MPTFWQDENLIHFAAQKKHLGIYPGELARLPNDLKERFSANKTTKGAIQMTYDKVDYELITDITKWRVKYVESKDV